jgi:hypothetical protein
MKSIFLFLAVFLALNVTAQLNPKLPAIDKSPLDISYYPANYPIMKIQDKTTDAPVMRVIYSRPQLNGRKVFGELQEYGKVWRMGANEATEIEFFKEVRIAGKKVKKGRYTFFAIPYADKWTLILNKETDTWGSFRYDAAKDVLRTNVPVSKNESTETMTIVFDNMNTVAAMNIYWDEVKVTLPIEF